MNDLTTQSPPPFNGSALRIELAKMLGLVAPITMSADQCTLWLASAEDALKDIRADEVAAISMEVRRTVTRPSQIVPEIAKLVAENRKHQRKMREYTQAAIPGPPVKRHIAERRRHDFVAADWAELNEWLERQGAKARYHPDGTRYFPANAT
jgi:hypothetical protein